MMFGWDDEAWWMLGIGALISLAVAIILMSVVLWLVHHGEGHRR